MKYEKFKEHDVKRTCTVHFDDYSQYRSFLENDFEGRCCYCNMSNNLVTVPYHVEHFIPIKVFKGKKDYLLTEYNNLMWACPKCNLSKGDKYQGNIEESDEIKNELFYNPVDVDYNDIFFRNEIGGIDSDDPKGREMIKLLKLYRPIHNLAWLLERLEKLLEKIEEDVEKESDCERRKILEQAAGIIARECVKKEKLFRTVYNGKQYIEEQSYEL